MRLYEAAGGVPYDDATLHAILALPRVAGIKVATLLGTHYLEITPQGSGELSGATIPLVARKGRASYLGQRSAGHQDPGATSTALLLRSAADSLP